MPPRHRIYIDCGEVAAIRLARSLAGALNLLCLCLDVRNDKQKAQSVLRLVSRVNGSPRAVPEHRHNRRLPLRDLCQEISFRTRQDFARIHNSQSDVGVVHPAGRAIGRPLRPAKSNAPVHSPARFDPDLQPVPVRGDMATVRILLCLGGRLWRRRGDAIYGRNLALV